MIPSLPLLSCELPVSVKENPDRKKKKLRLKTINWFMNHSLGILSSGVKFTLHLVHFMTDFELQLQKATKYFIYFWLQLVRLKSSKKPCLRFSITFLLFKILANITFLFPFKLVLKIENSSWHKNCKFFEESRARFCSEVVFPNVHRF